LRGLGLIAFLVLLVAGPGQYSMVNAAPQTGAAELDGLLRHHIPHRDPQNTGELLDVFEKSVDLAGEETPTVFRIPGFAHYQCGRCHKPDELVDQAAGRLRRTLSRLRENFPDIKTNPVRQYIIQTYSDALLSGRQLAHATFDTIRISPASILIDAKVYGESTHLHETLHLAQPFVGHVNELEAYGLNVRADPQFLILNYPYFKDVVQMYFLPELGDILETYFARGVNDSLKVPREVQWFIQDYSGESLAKLEQAIVKLEPLLKEVAGLYRRYPMEAAYWSARTGVRSLLLDLVAAWKLPVPEISLTPEQQGAGMEIINTQMKKDDNTRLGYVIDRKQESLMTLRYGLKIREAPPRRALYFKYLKENFIGADDEIKLEVKKADRDDFHNFVRKQIENVRKMMAYPGFTDIEREAAQAWIDGIQNQIPATP